MKHEDGFILPLAVILSLLFATVAIHQINLLEKDRQFFAERKNFFRHETILLSASNSFLSILRQSDEPPAEKGQFQYPFGSVTYEIIGQDEEIMEVKFVSTTNISGESRVNVFYHLGTKTIHKWKER